MPQEPLPTRSTAAASRDRASGARRSARSSRASREGKWRERSTSPNGAPSNRGDGACADAKPAAPTRRARELRLDPQSREQRVATRRRRAIDAHRGVAALPVRRGDERNSRALPTQNRRSRRAERIQRRRGSLHGLAAVAARGPRTSQPVNQGAFSGPSLPVVPTSQGGGSKHRRDEKPGTLVGGSESRAATMRCWPERVLNVRKPGGQPSCEHLGDDRTKTAFVVRPPRWGDPGCRRTKVDSALNRGRTVRSEFGLIEGTAGRPAIESPRGGAALPSNEQGTSRKRTRMRATSQASAGEGLV